MALKPTKDRNELCYPYIYEDSYLCDYEVATDELCSLVGLILSILPSGLEDVKDDLEHLQPLMFHLNGSIRGRLAVTEDDLRWLHGRYDFYQTAVADRINGFVLPQGSMPVPYFNMARSAAKKAIRYMVRVDQEGIEVPDILHRYCNLLCNLFFVLTLYINQHAGFEETPFISKSYPKNL